MALFKIILFVLGISAVTALPNEKVIRKTDSPRYQHVQGPDGRLHLADLWFKVSGLSDDARYNPDTQNVYHLFTRQNPTVSQPLLLGSNGLLEISNFSPFRRTMFLAHGWFDTPTGSFYTTIIPACLAAEDVNVIALDWTAGASSINVPETLAHAVASGQSVARFISWLNLSTGSTPAQYHLVGHSLGAHHVGITGRSLGGTIGYITALDPGGPGWYTNSDRFRASDGVYTEVIHTNAGIVGYLTPLGQTDFYPNGGVSMPGCGVLPDCSHDRAFFYLAESLQGGVFTGQRCASFVSAIAGDCTLPGNLTMGGLAPKTGSTGVFHLTTNPSPPFAQG